VAAAPARWAASAAASACRPSLTLVDAPGSIKCVMFGDAVDKWSEGRRSSGEQCDWGSARSEERWGSDSSRR
jgi:hypothetical protein